MTSFESLVPRNVVMAVWHMALHPAHRATFKHFPTVQDGTRAMVATLAAERSKIVDVSATVVTEPRKATSGGPRDRSKHIAYQKTYQTARKAKGYGVKLPDGTVERYQTRSEADKVRMQIKTGVRFFNVQKGA